MMNRGLTIYALQAYGNQTYNDYNLIGDKHKTLD